MTCDPLHARLLTLLNFPSHVFGSLVTFNHHSVKS